MTPVRITIYRFTGRQGFFTVPEAWCRECDLMVRAAERAAAESPVPVEIEVKPWWTHVFQALFRGGWHPPVLLVNGKRIVQGRVPTREELDEAVRRAGGR